MALLAPDLEVGLTALEVEAFSYGDCWRLALEVRRQFRMPVAFFASVVEGQPLDDVTMWCHAVNAVGDGRFVDARGIHTAKEIQAQWQDILWMDENSVAMVVTPGVEETYLMLSAQRVQYPEVDAAASAKRLGHLYGLSRMRRQAMRSRVREASC